ncbi:TPA: signal peptidase I [Candidatus Komeilibacteria bacterium]|nr:signal peptidase I [Candidatus Komeilibacteria bacterium]
MDKDLFPQKIFKKSDHDPISSAVKRFGVLMFETIKVILISMAIILPIRYFLIQPFIVEGASMEPTFESNEYLIVDELSYRFTEPTRGDVVVFRYQKDPRQFFIKRVVGLPGDKIEINDGTVYVNGNRLAEGYLDKMRLADSSLPEVTLTEDQYFLMGDNRANSLDSRIFGPVDRSYIVGKVWFRTWPFDRFSFFTAPQY